MDKVRKWWLGLLCAACVVPMVIAGAVLSSAGVSALDGVIDDADSCVRAGAMYLAEADECAFVTNVDVAADSTLVLGGGLDSFSFQRGLAVHGTLVANSVVTTPEDLTVSGTIELQGPATVSVVASGDGVERELFSAAGGERAVAVP